MRKMINGGPEFFERLITLEMLDFLSSKKVVVEERVIRLTSRMLVDILKNLGGV